MRTSIIDIRVRRDLTKIDMPLVTKIFLFTTIKLLSALSEDSRNRNKIKFTFLIIPYSLLGRKAKIDKPEKKLSRMIERQSFFFCFNFLPV